MKLVVEIPDETYTAIKNMTRIISGGRGSARKIEYDAFDAIYNGKPLPEWIPVSDRLPEDNELVLFSTKTDMVFEGRYFADKTDRQWYSHKDKRRAWNNVVLAWMPLPEPYKEESKTEKALAYADQDTLMPATQVESEEEE